ncbi:hypothetical protein [Paenibacillus luteus]|nr:hypothetical protein [Paenibacillus luteus]
MMDFKELTKKMMENQNEFYTRELAIEKSRREEKQTLKPEKAQN